MLNPRFHLIRPFVFAVLSFALPAGIHAAPAKKFVDNIPPDVQITRNLEYVVAGGSAQSLDLYLPPATTGSLPLVVFVHGGGWRASSKDEWHPSFHDLLTDGIAVANINYRLVQQAPFPAQIEDCKAAVRWLRAHAADYHIDPGHIGIWGHSAGGHLAALMGVSNGDTKLEGNEGTTGVSSSVQAACDWSGPTDLVKICQDGRAANPLLWDVTIQLIGASATVSNGQFAEASPVTHVSAGAVPFLIMQGAQDTVVPLDQSRELDAALKKAGVESTLIIVPGEGHGICQPPDLQHVTAFFDRLLKAKRRVDF